MVGECITVIQQKSAVFGKTKYKDRAIMEAKQRLLGVITSQKHLTGDQMHSREIYSYCYKEFALV